MLYWKREIGGALVALWKIEESFEVLLSMLQDRTLVKNILDIKSDKIKLEKIAVRVLIKTLFGQEMNVVYNVAGRPFLANSNMNISISHTKGFAAVALSKTREVGLDIEFISDKIYRVKERIVSKSEFIDFKQELNHLLLHWCAKESMFKVMDAEGVDYIDHLHVVPFTPSSEGWFVTKESKTVEGSTFDVYYVVESDFVLTCLLK